MVVVTHSNGTHRIVAARAAVYPERVCDEIVDATEEQYVLNMQAVRYEILVATDLNPFEVAPPPKKKWVPLFTPDGGRTAKKMSRPMVGRSRMFIERIWTGASRLKS